MRLGSYYRYLVVDKLNLPLSGNRILDVGCNDGFMLSHVNSKNKIGIDINPVMRYNDIFYINSDFIIYDFEGTRFNKIFAFDVIEHIKDDEKFIKKIVHLLEPNGQAMLSTPTKEISIFPKFLQNWIDERWEHNYRRGYEPEEIEQFLIEEISNGIINLNIMYWNCPYFRFFYLPLSLLWRISSNTAMKLLSYIIILDEKYKNGTQGYIFIFILKRL